MPSLIMFEEEMCKKYKLLTGPFMTGSTGFARMVFAFLFSMYEITSV